jgi:thiamine pyrophosphokinase
MRVVIVAGSPEPSNPRFVEKLCNTADYLIAADSGANMLFKLDRVPDLLCGDEDSLNAETLVWLDENNVAVEKVSWYKDDTDLGLALKMGMKHAAEQNRRANFTVTCASGGRVDHMLGVFGVLAQLARTTTEQQCTLHLQEDDFLCRLLRPGERWVLPLDASGHVLSAISLDTKTVLTEQGMLWCPIHSEFGVLDDRGVSNQVQDKDASIVCEQGLVAAILLRQKAEAMKQQ